MAMNNNNSATINSAIASAKPCKRTNYCTKDAQPFRELVEDYMMRTFWYPAIMLEREQELKSMNELISNLKNAKGSILWNPQQYVDALELRDKKDAQLKEWIDRAEVKWTVKKDSALSRTYTIYQKHMQNGDTADYSIRMAVLNLYREYDLVCGSEDMVYIMDACKGKDPQSLKKVCQSGQSVWNGERKKATFCKVLMNSIVELMIMANAVRPVRIAPELEAKYKGLCRADKKSKKSEKKATTVN